MTGGAIALLLAAGLAAGPGIPAGSPAPGPVAGGASPDTIVVEDDAGRTSRFAEPPRRIVSLAPAFTEILFALGAGDRVVGRTRYGVHPPEARDVPSVGEGVRPSMEMILSRDPDAVVLYAGASNRRALQRLEDLAVPTVALEHDVIADFYRNVARLGRLVERNEEADRLAASVRCRLRQVAAHVRDRPPRRVYYEVWADPPITAGAGSYLDSLLTVAGGVNVFGDLEASSPRVSLEAIVDRDPELILVPEQRGEADAPPPSERPGWEVLEAVREGRVRTVNGDLVHRLGPRLGEAARVLARAVHPDLGAEAGRAPETACSRTGRESGP